MDLKETPLTQEHLLLEAKMAPFAGFNMPVSYKGIIEEHHCVRNNVGIFDVSHMGEFLLKGKDSVPFLNYVTTGNFTKLKNGKARYTILCNENGGIVDDIIVYRFQEDDMLICVNASNIDKDWKHLTTIAKNFDITLNDISSSTGLIAVQGPSAPSLMAVMFSSLISEMRPFTVLSIPYNGEEVTIASTGYTGEKGYEVFASPVTTKLFWQDILKKGKEFHIQPIGLGARDTLRLEKKYPLYGNDLDDGTSPVEAGLGRFIDGTKENYIGKKRIHEEIAHGPQRTWVSLSVAGKRIPRHGHPLLSGSEEIGVVTSGSFSPSLSAPIATAYVRSDLSKIGTKLSIDVRGRKIDAEVVPSFL